MAEPRAGVSWSQQEDHNKAPRLVAYRKRDSSWVGVISYKPCNGDRGDHYVVELAEPLGTVPSGLRFQSFGAAQAYVDAMYNNQDGDRIQLPPAPDPWRARRPGEEVLPVETALL